MACSPIGAYDRRKNQYIKILALGERVKKLIVYAPELQAKIDACGILPEGDFDVVADFPNMHMWLTKNMHIAELQYATIVTELLERNSENMDKIKDVVENQAKLDAAVVPASIDAQDAFQYLSKYYLDGMPCDDVKVIDENTEKLFSWTVINDTHTPFWEKAGGNVDIYYELLELYVNTLFAGKNIKYSYFDNKHFSLAVY